MNNRLVIKRLIITSFIILGYVIFLKLLGMTCLIKNIFGVSCPGCGMTRACFSALRFNFKLAFYYHPLWILLIPSVLVLLFLYFKNKKTLFKIVVIGLVTLLIIVYIIRLIYSDHSIVYIDFKQSYIYDLIQFIKNSFK